MAPDDKLKRSVNSLLNKLTPEKFVPILRQFLELKITTSDLLRDAVDAVFEKALSEPNFTPTYAHFSIELEAKAPKFDDEQGQCTFRKLMLTNLQEEFQKKQSVQLEEIESTPDLTEEQKSDRKDKLKKRRFGMIRFIGELYLRGMFDRTIIHHVL